MKLKKIINSLSINLLITHLDKNIGYYMKKNPFGKKGDFITSPNISRLFSEMIAIWIISFWQSLGSPKKFNLIELGSGNGEMIKIIIESFKNFPSFLNSCNIKIYEKSPSLIKIQKKKLINEDVYNLKLQIEKFQVFSLLMSFDAIAIKQFLKKNLWFERFVGINDHKKLFF